MPMTAPYTTYAKSKVIPLYNSQAARVVPVNLPPNSTFVPGLILGQVTSAANAVQTITAPGSGTYIISGTNPLTGLAFSTTALAFGANDATVQAALIAALGTGITVASLAVTFGGQFAARPVPLMTASAGSIANTTTGRSAKTFKAYASGNSDGSQNPSMILEYGGTTDAFGNFSHSDTVAGAASRPYATAFYAGTFDCADLTGLDANAVTKMGGRIVAGTVTAGTFSF